MLTALVFESVRTLYVAGSFYLVFLDCANGNVIKMIPTIGKLYIRNIYNVSVLIVEATLNERSIIQIVNIVIVFFIILSKLGLTFTVQCCRTLFVFH